MIYITINRNIYILHLTDRSTTKYDTKTQTQKQKKVTRGAPSGLISLKKLRRVVKNGIWTIKEY